MNVGKDTDLVVEFLSHFSKLKECIDDEPGGLTELSNEDSFLTGLCRKIYSSACKLKAAEGTRRELFVEGSNPGFIKIWRDFESRYAATIGNIAVSPLFGGGIFNDIESHVKLNAEIGADLFQKALEFAEAACSHESFSELPSDDFFDDDEGSGRYSMTVEECVQHGLSGWRNFTDATGFDLESVLIRRAMVPFVLVPRHVSGGIGNAEKFSLFTQLKEAHDAFIFGLPHASMAMMRSTLEVVLKKHYGAQGDTLAKLIKDVGRRLPQSANVSVLWGIKNAGNQALHGEKGSEDKVSELSSDITNDTILYFLHKLRVLIEEAPATPVSR